MSTEKRFAVLIDADNISYRYIKYILTELARDGIATYKRIYGDWTRPEMNTWKQVLLESSIIPMQQYAYTNGKNSTDSALIIDAMDILYTGSVDGFCLVSSDSDFTRLAARLREAGKEVIGMGEGKTPAPFRNACNKFRYLEVLEQAGQATAEGEAPAAPAIHGSDKQLDTIREAVVSILNDNSDEEGKISLSHVGTALANRYPDFDVRNFGHNKLSRFMTSLGFRQVQTAGSRGIYIALPAPKAAPKAEKPKKKPPSQGGKNGKPGGKSGGGKKK